GPCSTGRSIMAPGNDPSSVAGPPAEDESQAGGLTRRRLLQHAAAAGIVVGSSGLLGAAGEAWAATPKRGGTLRIGMVGGGQSETLDPNLAVSTIDTCRMLTLYDLLVHAKPDLSLEMRLATEILPNKSATRRRFTLRRGG